MFHLKKMIYVELYRKDQDAGIEGLAKLAAGISVKYWNALACLLESLSYLGLISINRKFILGRLFHDCLATVTKSSFVYPKHSKIK